MWWTITWTARTLLWTFSCHTSHGNLFLKVGHVLLSNSIVIIESKTEFFGRLQTSSISHPLLHVGHLPMDPGCPDTLSTKDEHFSKRHLCWSKYTEINDCIILHATVEHTQFRIDSALFKTRLTSHLEKCYQYYPLSRSFPPHVCDTTDNHRKPGDSTMDSISKHWLLLRSMFSP